MKRRREGVRAPQGRCAKTGEGRRKHGEGDDLDEQVSDCRVTKSEDDGKAGRAVSWGRRPCRYASKVVPYLNY